MNERPGLNDDQQRTNVLEQVPPHDEAAEAAALGSILIDPRAADIVFEELIDDDFYLPRHRLLFKQLKEIFQKQEVLDEVYVCSELQRRGQLEAIGGRDTIGRLIMDTPGAAGVEGYCELVKSRSVERDILMTAGKMLRLIQEPTAADSNELIESCEKMVYDVSEKRRKDNEQSVIQTLSNILHEAEAAQVCRRLNKPHVTRALPTMFGDLDNLLAGGLWPGEMTILAARPSMGKTTLAMNIVRKNVLSHIGTTGFEPIPIAFFSIEMPKEQILKNLISAEKEIQTHKMRRMDLDDEEHEKLQWAIRKFNDAQLFIEDTGALTLQQLRSQARRLKHGKNIQLLVVDYLQLMKPENSKISREQQVSELSRGAKAIARDLDIPLIMIAQLNRGSERRDEDKRPQLSDLRDSGAIEQDADCVIMLHRADYYDLQRAANPAAVCDCMVMKNRNGAVGNVKLTFRKDILRFDNFTPDDGNLPGMGNDDVEVLHEYNRR